MAEQNHRILSGADSDLHDEPHVAGSRITVRFIHEQVEGAGHEPRSIADRFGLDIAAVYHALAYYHEHRDEMRRVERERERVIEDHRERAITGPNDLE